MTTPVIHSTVIDDTVSFFETRTALVIPSPPVVAKKARRYGVILRYQLITPELNASLDAEVISLLNKVPSWVGCRDRSWLEVGAPDDEYKG